MWKFAGAIVFVGLGAPALAHDSALLNACREEARGLTGAELDRYVKVCVEYARALRAARSVQGMRVAATCKPAATGLQPARGCGPAQR